MSKEKKSVWATLSAIDVKDKTKKKGDMTYLPWAWAWGELKKKYPEATFKKHIHDGMAYIKDEKGNTFVEVTVTVEGISATELYPVTDNKYNAILNPDAFEVNTAFQRALVKAIAYHGLGHHLYAGEDVPEGNAETPQSEGKSKEEVDPIQEATPTPPPPTEAPTKVDLDKAKKEGDWSMLTDTFHELINAHESKDTLAKLWENNKKALKLLKEKRPNDYKEVYGAFEKRGEYIEEKANG